MGEVKSTCGNPQLTELQVYLPKIVSLVVIGIWALITRWAEGKGGHSRLMMKGQARCRAGKVRLTGEQSIFQPERQFQARMA